MTIYLSVDIVKKNFFPDTDFSFIKILPPIAELTFRMLKDKKEQTDKDALKRWLPSAYHHEC